MEKEGEQSQQPWSSGAKHIIQGWLNTTVGS